MAGMVLRKTGVFLLNVLKWGLLILLWVLKLTLGMAKLFLLLFALVVRMVLVVCTGNPCAYFRSISPIAQVKKPRRSTTTSAFFDLHSRKNILRNMHKDFRYGLLVMMGVAGRR